MVLLKNDISLFRCLWFLSCFQDSKVFYIFYYAELWVNLKKHKAFLYISLRENTQRFQNKNCACVIKLLVWKTFTLPILHSSFFYTPSSKMNLIYFSLSLLVVTEVPHFWAVLFLSCGVLWLLCSHILWWCSPGLHTFGYNTLWFLYTLGYNSRDSKQHCRLCCIHHVKWFQGSNSQSCTSKVGTLQLRHTWLQSFWFLL